MNNRREYHKNWRDQNRSHVNSYNRSYQRENTEQRAATSKRYRHATDGNREHFIKQLVRTARNNASKHSEPFSLTFELINAWISLQGDRCILTGIAFDYGKSDDYRTRPFAPSIDRKNNKRGYTIDNIQIVICMVNKAKNEFSQDMFDAMCIARVRMIDGQI